MRKQQRTIILLTVLVLLVTVSPTFAAEEAGGSPLDTLGINLGFLISQLVNFGLITGVLTLLLWKPAVNAMDARAAKIQKGVEDANAAANARKNAEAEAEKILAQARQEANQIIAQASGRGDEAAKSIQVAARDNADKIAAEAKTRGEEAVASELAGLRGQVAQIAVAISERLIGASMDDKKQKELVSSFLSNVPADGKNLGGDVTVISAMPLEAPEQDKVKKELSKANSVTFKVDPTILGGLVLRAGDRVVDGSVKSNLTSVSALLS